MFLLDSVIFGVVALVQVSGLFFSSSGIGESQLKIPPLCTCISSHLDLEKSKINLALINDVSFLGITPWILSASTV